MSRRRPSQGELLEKSPYGEDLDRELMERPARQKASKLTVTLAAGVVLMAGVLLGIQAQKIWGPSSTSDRQALVAGLLSGQGGGLRQGSGQGQGALGNTTFGTVKLVDGNKIYVEANGATTVVTTSGDTKIQIAKEGKVGDIKPGSTVIVQGERDADGNVAATTVSEGGFPGVGGR
ncbi:hypothetical protein Aple_079740 [Acrocarpospora pleiomorpha]|uniref:DUF5666 domain-containing protein n=1 Tax=Acrocarpospora pleiomorpha TaxID=90975 RepID=A0A5M3XV58_9ACTN|nr:hypothetical protein [Acrocarpospora pleiomorpha]GES25075.1 hypothetical protein Aple_079740 [Acrocarpospora pleiomorpha]